MAKKQSTQNKQLTAEALAKKYGDTMVGVVPLTDNLKKALGKGGLLTDATYVEQATVLHGRPVTVKTPITSYATGNMEYMRRCEAEINEEYLQPITYALIQHGQRGNVKFFCTKRIGEGGDERLNGLYSIGIGGHIDDLESIPDAFYRELEEEIGMFRHDIFVSQAIGTIYDTSTAVGRVHLGLVRRIWVSRDNINVKEPDKLEGSWKTIDELVGLKDEGRLESWSALCVNYLMENK